MTLLQYFVCCITLDFQLNSQHMHWPVACTTQSAHTCWGGDCEYTLL